jgi:hypothetical protein
LSPPLFLAPMMVSEYAPLATVFHGGRVVGFILHRGINYEATGSAGAVSIGFYPSQREAAAAHVNVSVLYQFIDTAKRSWPTNVAPRQYLPVGQRAARSLSERWPADLPRTQ